jgi:hypothetical protein
MAPEKEILLLYPQAFQRAPQNRQGDLSREVVNVQECGTLQPLLLSIIIQRISSSHEKNVESRIYAFFGSKVHKFSL